MNEPLTIIWHPNIRDIGYAIRLGWWGTPGRVIRSLILFFVFPGIFLGWFVHVGTRGYFSPTQSALAGLAFGVLGGGLLLFGLSAWFARSMLKTQRARGDRPHRIVLTEEGVERIVSDVHIKHAWSGISRIEEHSRMFILYGASGPLASIEKSGISSTTDLNAVRAFFREKKPGRYLSDEST